MTQRRIAQLKRRAAAMSFISMATVCLVPGWLPSLLGALREGRAAAVCGYTTYRGGYWAAIQSLLDFGFLMPPKAGPVGCYPCNNWAAHAGGSF